MTRSRGSEVMENRPRIRESVERGFERSLRKSSRAEDRCIGLTTENERLQKLLIEERQKRYEAEQRVERLERRLTVKQSQTREMLSMKEEY